MFPIGESDLADVLELNQRWVPEVGTLTADSLRALLAEAAFTRARRGADGVLEGFVIVLGPGASYGSANYRYFAARHEQFTYVDRIAVNPDRRRSGLGSALYRETANWARSHGSGVVCCEVNLQPPNPDSQAFHAGLGFAEVGTQWTYGDTVEVRMLECATERLLPVGGDPQG